MTNFIFEVLNDLHKKQVNLSEITFILPSKRAGVFLKHQIPNVTHQTQFSPTILSIEEFIEELSQLKSISNPELVFHFYNIYLELTHDIEPDSFETFSKWAQVLLQDFNEIDRYLIPQKKIFNYLSAIQDLKHWSLEENSTDFIKKYLLFWRKLPDYYTHFSEHLLNRKIGFQGLIYREAVENLEAYIQNNSKKLHVFLGFNALNTAEETIIQELLQNGLAQIYWDIDEVFLNNENHDAALFTRKHKKYWTYFKQHPFNWVTKNYSTQKNVSIVGVPKNIGQAKYIGSLINTLHKKKISLQNTAIILGDENLLIPVLNSLPLTIEAFNITMGFPLKTVPLASLFESLFQLHKNPSKAYYYKDVITILSNQFIRPLLFKDREDFASKIIDTIESNNILHISLERLKQLAPHHQNILNDLFSNWDNTIETILTNCRNLILKLKANFDNTKSSDLLPLEYLYRFNSLFNELSRLNEAFNHIKNVSTLHSIYIELLNSETLDFQGEPLQGLQIMGMLESRVLDFETVIIASVNEGILPSGKSNNSFIPFDVKIENNLPTYKEKDAVYTYHFYRLLQRAKNIHLIYNTEADVLTGGEKSRFIRQIEFENIHKTKHQIITPLIPVKVSKFESVEKNEALSIEIKKLAEKGFSPSSLTSYIRNPIEFYQQKILKIKEHNEVEETVAANTLGTIVHNTLEEFYKPFIGKYLTEEAIKQLKQMVELRVAHYFINEYKEGDITTGKNLIIYEIAKRYVTNFLDLEFKDLEAGNKIKILYIEADCKVKLNIPELNFPVNLVGKVDRIDAYNDCIRIIDYKTGRVEQSHVEILNWDDITTDYDKYSKPFQILTYALMMYYSNQLKLPVEAGIISFKNLNAGFLKFAKKDKMGNGAKKDFLITKEVLENFRTQLKTLILEICDVNTPFTEKEV